MVVTYVRGSWIDQIINRLGRTVSRTPVTKTTDNITGAETLSEGTPANILAIFLTQRDRWNFSPEGLVEEADAYLLVKDDVTVNKNDKITVDSRDYRVHDVVIRYSDSSNSTAIYKFVTMFLDT